jgi:hypothetical protein
MRSARNSSKGDLALAPPFITRHDPEGRFRDRTRRSPGPRRQGLIGWRHGDQSPQTKPAPTDPGRGAPRTLAALPGPK